MKTLKLVLGILVIVFSSMGLLVSCTGMFILDDTMLGVYSTCMMAFTMAGGIITIATRRKENKAGSISSIIVFIIAICFGLLAGGSLLSFWSLGCLVLIVIHAESISREKRIQRNIEQKNQQGSGQDILVGSDMVNENGLSNSKPKKVARLGIVSKISIVVACGLIILTIAGTIILKTASLADKANWINLGEKFCYYPVAEESTIADIQEEFFNAYESGEKEECISALNDVDQNHLPILICEESRTAEINDTEYVQLAVSSPETILDMMSKLGWENFHWDDMKIRCFLTAVFNSKFDPENGESEYDRAEVILYYDKFEDIPSDIKEKIELSGAEFELYKSYWIEEKREEAITRATIALEDQLKNPDSLEIYSSEAQVDSEGNAIVVISYSATNSFGGRIKDVYQWSQAHAFSDTPEECRKKLM